MKKNQLTIDNFAAAMRRQASGEKRVSLLEALSAEGFSSPIIFHGKDEFRIRRAVVWLRDTFFDAGTGVSVYLGSDLSSAASALPLAAAAKQATLFAPSQLVLIYRVDQVKSACGKELLEIFKKPSSAAAFLFTADDISSAKGNFLKELLPLCTEIAVPELAGEARRKWIEREAQRLCSSSGGGGITPDAAQALSEAFPGDLGAAANSLQQLLLSVPAGSTITRKIVEELTSVAGGESNNFELFLRIARKNRAGAVCAALELLRAGTHPLQSNALLSRAVRMILARKVSSGQLSTELAHAWIWRQIGGAERSFSKEELRRALPLLRELDLELKSSNLPPDLAFTVAVERLAARDF